MKNNILNFSNDIQTNDNSNKFYIKKLKLKNFRNHVDLSLNISKASLLIYGDNGCGKTNILEAISLLNQGKALESQTLKII